MHVRVVVHFATQQLQAFVFAGRCGVLACATHHLQKFMVLSYSTHLFPCAMLQGPGALYWGFVPFLIESFPYDITELGTYSQLSDMKDRAVSRTDTRSKWMAQVPDQVGGVGK